MTLKQRILHWWFEDHPAELEKRGLLTQEYLEKVLGHMDLCEIAGEENIWNTRFTEMVPFMYRYPFALRFIEQYDYARELYFDYLRPSHPERNYEYQKVILSTDEKGVPLYPKILAEYKRQYMFLEGIKKFFQEEGKSNLLT